ncbi:MAG: hypothetical protein AABW50_05640 [Nanoarchaeota archaeon]
MKFLIFLFMFLVFGALLVISNHGISFSESEDLSDFKNLYVNWLIKIFGNFGKITGDFVKLDWSQ